MIPKIIHYCWFGGNPLPDLAKKCISSWKKFLPDYEIKEWNEQNVDFSQCPVYVQEAYQAKKWAFVSDYVRLKVLYKYGGLYFDTDVEVIKSLDPILKHGMYMGGEVTTQNGQAVHSINPGLGFAVEPGVNIIKEILDSYQNDHFLNEDGSCNLKTIVTRTTEIFARYGYDQTKNDIQYIAEIYVYPEEYFSPKSLVDGKMRIKSNTYSIHHYMASWESHSSVVRGKIYRFCLRTFGERFSSKMRKIFTKKDV